MILLVGLFFKMIKWALVILVYLVIGVAKLVAIVVVLCYFGVRAVMRSLRRERDDQVSDPYQGLYDLEDRSHPVSQDRFDAVWQQERDRRVAATQTTRTTGRTTAIPRDDWVHR